MDLLEQQLRLEDVCCVDGIHNYHSRKNDKKGHRKSFSDTSIGRNLAKRYIIPIKQVIQERLKSTHVSREAGVQQAMFTYCRVSDEKHTQAVEKLREALSSRIISQSKYNEKVRNENNKLFDRRVRELAYLTVKSVVNIIGNTKTGAKVSLTTASIALGKMFITQHKYNVYKRDYPSYVKRIEENKKKSTQAHVQKLLRLESNKRFKEEDDGHTVKEKIAVGTYLLNLALRIPNLFRKDNIREGRTKNPVYLLPSPMILKWIEEKDEYLAVLNPVCMPMIIPPTPWTSLFGGGYKSDAILQRHPLVKDRDKKRRRRLEEVDLSKVFSAVNRVQETPWQINRKIFEVVDEIWSTGGNLGGVCGNYPEPPPTKQWGNISNDEYKAYKAKHPDIVAEYNKKNTEWNDKRCRTSGKRTQQATMIRVADTFKDYPEIYYPHSLDFRGRVYPIPICGGLHPQGNDLGKALLQFANGKPLGERGLFWLKIHLANCYGKDKISFDERLKWVEENEAAILDSAENPLDGQRFWCALDENKKLPDSPFCFLAACFEYKGYKEEGLSYVSSIPIALDGSCNGLQNFAGLLRDEEGGKVVNLVPTETPSDIYTDIMNKVDVIINREAEDGDELAQFWIGKVTRKIAKRNVMTYPYGATQYGFTEQIIDILEGNNSGIKNWENGDNEEVDLESNDYFHHAKYLANKMWQVISETVHSAHQVMKWLRDLATITNLEGNDIHWQTPDGFIVTQHYKEQDAVKVPTFWGTMLVDKSIKEAVNQKKLDKTEITLQIYNEKLDKTKQSSAISPNFIHSLDATHLRMTVNTLAEKGIRNFAMIHDSYGTLAADTDLMAECLRECFIKLYSENDVLADLRDQVLRQVDEKYHSREVFKELPTKGSLELESIRDSKYFFA